MNHTNLTLLKENEYIHLVAKKPNKIILIIYPLLFGGLTFSITTWAKLEKDLIHFSSITLSIFGFILFSVLYIITRRESIKEPFLTYDFCKKRLTLPRLRKSFSIKEIKTIKASSEFLGKTENKSLTETLKVNTESKSFTIVQTAGWVGSSFDQLIQEINKEIDRTNG